MNRRCDQFSFNPALFVLMPFDLRVLSSERRKSISIRRYPCARSLRKATPPYDLSSQIKCAAMARQGLWVVRPRDKMERKENAMQMRSRLLLTKSLFPAASFAVMSLALGAQTTASPQGSDQAPTPGTTQSGSQPAAATAASTPQQTQHAAPVQATSLSAELTKGIDTKKAKTGDEINAKTTTDAKLPDGTALPKGTKLVGNVVEVTAKSKEQKNSHLVISLNRAVTKDGHDMPIRAAVTSVTAQATMAASMDAPMSGGAAMAPGGGGAASGAPSGSGSASTPMPSSNMPTMASNGDTPTTTQQGATLKSIKDRVPVGNMPNVVLSAPTTPQSAAVLDAQNENISLQSGTKFTVNISPAQSGQ